MRIPFRLALLALGVVGAVGCAAPRSQTPAETPAAPGSSPSIAFRGGHWLDGTRFVDRTMYSVGGRFSASPPPRVDRVLDLGGGYVVPPFAEGHNHWLEPRSIEAYDAMYLRDGVFYLKDQANATVIRRQLDAALNRPTTVDFICANEGWTGPGGHPVQIALQFLKFGSFPPEWTESNLDPNVVNVVEDVAGIEQRWPKFIAGRPDFVKVFLLYSEEYAKRRNDPQYQFKRGIDPALVAEIARRAHAAGLRLSAHVYTAADFHNALVGGVDDMAHMPGTGWEESMGVAAFRISESDARLAAERGTTVTTTLSWLAELGESDAAEQQKVLEQVIRPNLQLLRRFGVPILIGSDQFRQTPAGEARLLVKLGLFSTAEVLHTWCELTPRAMFPKRQIGRLADGYEASFLVLDGDPLADFAATGKIRLRVKQGTILPEPATVTLPDLPGSGD
jgi:hypothetical protein